VQNVEEKVLHSPSPEPVSSQRVVLIDHDRG
jgi:hypothetical protein